MLADLDSVKHALEIDPSDTSHDNKLALLLEGADWAIKSYCHRDFETQVYTEFPFKGGAPDLPLLQRPLRPVLLTGDLTAGSPTISNLAGTLMYTPSQLFVGQTVAVTGAAAANLRTSIPPFTTITAATSTTATMSQNAAVSGTAVPLIFGLDVYIDFGGNYGFGNNAFRNGPSNSSRLFAGLDYAPEIDQPDGTCKSGLLVLFGQSGFGSGLSSLVPLGWGYGNVSGYGPYGGPLTTAMPPLWPTYPGSVRVDYTAGLGIGAKAPRGPLPVNTTLPQDLVTACITLTIYMFQYVSTGMIQVQSTSFQGYTQHLVRSTSKNTLGNAEDLGKTRDILSRYIEIAV